MNWIFFKMSWIPKNLSYQTGTAAIGVMARRCPLSFKKRGNGGRVAFWEKYHW